MSNVVLSHTLLQSYWAFGESLCRKQTITALSCFLSPVYYIYKEDFFSNILQFCNHSRIIYLLMIQTRPLASEYVNKHASQMYLNVCDNLKKAWKWLFISKLSILFGPLKWSYNQWNSTQKVSNGSQRSDSRIKKNHNYYHKNGGDKSFTIKFSEADV